MERIEPKDMVEGEKYYIEYRLWGDEVKPVPHRKKIGTFRFEDYGSGVFENVINIDDGSEDDSGEVFSSSGYKFYKVPSRNLTDYQKKTYRKLINQGLKDQPSVSDIGTTITNANLLDQQPKRKTKGGTRRRKSYRRKKCRKNKKCSRRTRK
jgi:hypothetical protein